MALMQSSLLLTNSIVSETLDIIVFYFRDVTVFSIASNKLLDSILFDAIERTISL